MSDQQIDINIDDLFKLIGIQTVQINTLKSQLREIEQELIECKSKETSNSEKSKEESKHVNNIEEK